MQGRNYFLCCCCQSVLILRILTKGLLCKTLLTTQFFSSNVAKGTYRVCWHLKPSITTWRLVSSFSTTHCFLLSSSPPLCFPHNQFPGVAGICLFLVMLQSSEVSAHHLPLFYRLKNSQTECPNSDHSGSGLVNASVKLTLCITVCLSLRQWAKPKRTYQSSLVKRWGQKNDHIHGETPF